MDLQLKWFVLPGLREPAVLVSVLLWFLWHGHDRLLADDLFQPLFHLHAAHHVWDYGQRPFCWDAAGYSWTVQDRTGSRGQWLPNNSATVYLGEVINTNGWNVQNIWIRFIYCCAFKPFFLQQYKFTTFWVSILDAFYQSLVCFFVPYLVSETFELSILDYTLCRVSFFMVHPLSNQLFYRFTKSA